MAFASNTNPGITLGNTFGKLFSSTPGATITMGPRTSYIFPVLAGIVGIAIVVAIVIAIVGTTGKKPATQLTGPIDLFKPASPVLIDRKTTGKSMKGTYTLSFYLSVSAVPDMRTAATPLFTWPGVWDLGYNPSQEQLVFNFKQTPDMALSTATETITLPRIPLQKWSQVAMVFEGRTADLFINGQLVKSDSLNNVPPAGASSITIVPGNMHGQVAYVQLWNRRLKTAEIAADYAATSDSQGRPLISPGFFGPLGNLSVLNPFCSGGDCGGSTPTATPSQTWDFPYQ
jgi:hypothetical protein